MKKQLTILLLIISFGAFSQTYDNLPSGFVPYGTQYYKNPAGKIIVGTSAGKFRIVSQQKELDSLYALTTKNPLSFSAGRIPFTTGANTLGSSSLLKWDNSNQLMDVDGLLISSGIQSKTAPSSSNDVMRLGDMGGYIRNNNTGTPQTASANINGTFKVDNANGTSYILGGIGSFSTTAGVTSIDGGTLDAKKISAGITPSIAGVEMGNGGSASLAYISAKSSDGTSRALNVLSSALNLNGTVTSNDNFSVNGTSTFNQGFTSNGLGTFNTGFKTLNNPNYFVGSASLDFARDNTLVNNIKVKAPIGYTGAHEQQLQAATGTIALTSDLDNLVTLNTIQTISGRKTFTSNMDMQNGEINFTNGSSTYPNSSMFYGGISIKNGVDNYVSIFPNNIYVQKGSGLSTVIGTVQPTGQRTVNFPDASGTIALTSDVSALSAQKGQANGFASLDANGKLLNSQVPALALVDTYVVTSQAAMLALPAEQGDVAIRNDESKTYILQSNPSTTLANWVPLKTPQSPVESVNGQTGIVSLNKADINLGNVDNTSDQNKPVSTATQMALNNKLGLTGGTMTGSINASGIDNYGPTKIRGNFDGIDAISFNVPTYTTTTNGNAVASTKFVQDRLASGQSIGANAASATLWNSLDFSPTISGTPDFLLGYYGSGAAVRRLTLSTLGTALGINDGSSLNNVASSATNWGGLPANFSANPVISDILSANPFPIYNSNTFRFEATSPSVYKQALATSLQDVTSVGNTTNQSLIGNGEDSYFSWDSNTNRRLGFVKKSGFQPFLAYGGDDFQIVESNTSSILPSNTFTPRFVVTTGGNVGIGTTSPAVKLDVAGDIKANNLTSGTYTPTVTMGSGLTSNTAHACHYTRVGNEVTVHGWVEVTASSLSGNTNYSITLPVASNMTSSDDLSGVGQYISSGQGTTKVMGDAANDKAIISVSVQAGVPLPSYFSFTYTIK